MLVLSRKISTTTFITVPPSSEPQEIEVMVCAVERGKCRLGFRAEKTVVIERAELREEYVAPPKKG